MKYALGNMLNGAGGLNPDGLSLDLQFAADKTLTARKGPTPVLTRGSGNNGGTTYFGPSSFLVDFTYAGSFYNTTIVQQPSLGLSNGRWRWSDGSDVELKYNGTSWELLYLTSIIHTSSPTTAWLPDSADWGTTGVLVSELGDFGIVKAANDEPRFDHNPVTLSCRGLLIEEGRTNLCLQSNAFSTSPWGNINSVCAVTQNETGVDGIANSAWTFTDDSVTQGEGRYITATLTSGVACSYSIFVKKTTGAPSTYPAIWLARSGTFGGCVINTTAGTATPITAFGAGTIISTTASVVDFGNFWRVTSFVTPTATGSWEISISPSGNGTGTGVMDGTTTGSAVFWGAQLEAGSFATSYIPTTTGTLARSADVCSITGANFTNLWNASEGTMLVNSFTPASGDRTVVSADDNTSNEMIRLRTEVTNPFFKVTDGGSELVAIDSGTVVANTAFKLAGAYKLNDFASSINGGVAVTDTTGTVPTVDRMRIGAGQGGNTMCGCVSSMRYYKKRLSDSKIQTLTV